MKRTPLKRKTPMRAKRKAERREPRNTFGGGPKLPKRTMRKKRPWANAGEREHLNKVSRMGCLICGRPSNIHHIRTGYGIAERATHWEILPLCKEHHQDGPMGVAFHAGPRTWMAKYGTEIALLKQVYDRLEIPFERLPELRGHKEPPPWWASYLSGAALVAKGAEIFEKEDEACPARP